MHLILVLLTIVFFEFEENALLLLDKLRKINLNWQKKQQLILSRAKWNK